MTAGGSEDGALAAWRDLTERFPDTTTVDLVIPDLAGIERGKRLTAEGFAGALASGLTFASSVYGMDATGTNVAASGLIWEEGDADRPVTVHAATLVPVPWRPGGAQVLAGLRETDGTPFFGDPRAVLERVAARLRARDLHAVAALELEFHLVEVGDGPPRPAATRLGATTGPGQVYGLAELGTHEAFLDLLQGYCAAQDLPLKSMVSEYAPGQYEANLGHVADPVRAADHAFLLKRAVKAAARAAGLEATFMAMPFAGGSASGMHVHVSLVDAAGTNRFAADPALLRHALGGLAATMSEAMLIFAPNANSFRRLRPGSYAPTAPGWGYNNRTVALRVPAGPDAARRIEHRTAGADANPYLVLAAVLAGIDHGLEHRLDPGAPIEGNAYAQLEPGLSLSWERAIAAFTGADVLPAHLGTRFCRLYAACRGAERDRFDDVVTPTEYAWYLRPV